MTTVLDELARIVAEHRGWNESYDDEFEANRYHRDNGPSQYYGEVRAVLSGLRAHAEALADVDTCAWTLAGSNAADVIKTVVDDILNATNAPPA